MRKIHLAPLIANATAININKADSKTAEKAAENDTGTGINI